MGSNQFQREYIEYLQDRNTELLNKLSHMKENYENKIFSKDLSKHYLLTTLEDILGVCTSLPQEIDLFFEKMTGAMEILASILLRKSEMVQLVEKISQTINFKRFETNVVENFASEKELNPDLRSGKKAGTVKVSPMINGHVIATDPKIYLSRISKDLTPRRRRDLHQLSPIIEASPDADLSDLERCSFKELRIPLERLNLRNLSHFNGDSPKGRFKGPKTWKKSLSLKKQKSDTSKAHASGEDQEILKENTKVEIEKPKLTNQEMDPLEGPSWLYDENNCFSKSPICNKTDYIDYRRRKHRFASVFDRNEDFLCLEPTESKVETLTKYESAKVNKSCLDSDSVSSSEFKDCNEVINETFKDFIPESASEEEGNSFYEKKIHRKKRKFIMDSSSEKYVAENEGSAKTNSSKSRRKSQNCDISLHKSDSNYEADNEENSAEHGRSVNRSYRRRRSRTIFDELPMEISPGFESTPKAVSTPGFSERKLQTSKKAERKNSKSKSGEKRCKKSKKLQKEIIIKLEDCLASNETTSRLPRSKTKSFKSRLEVSSPVNPLECEGRKKRKAAPTNLSEPSLNTKLRRE